MESSWTSASWAAVFSAAARNTGLVSLKLTTGLRIEAVSTSMLKPLTALTALQGARDHAAAAHLLSPMGPRHAPFLCSPLTSLPLALPVACLRSFSFFRRGRRPHRGG